MKTASSYRKLSAYPVILLRFIVLLSLIGASTWRPVKTVAQANDTYIRLVRTIETSDMGLVNPAGLAYSPNANGFHITEAHAPGEIPPFFDLVTVTPFEDLAGSARIEAAIKDPINMAFDSFAMRLLILQPVSKKLIEVSEGADGQLDPTTLIRHDIRHISVQNPQGITVDPSSGHIYILDSAGLGILRIEPDINGDFEYARISTIDLSGIDLVDARGLAFDPTSGHLHILNPVGQVLSEITDHGQVVGTRKLSESNLTNPQGMVFAPSADLTDDPAQMHLYIADSGQITQQTQGNGLIESNLDMSAGGELGGDTGNITELSFNQIPSVAAADFTASLVQTIDTSTYNPPSPDPSGLAYLPSSNTLLMVDGEVEETVSGITHFDGVNVWETTLGGGVVNTANISKIAPTVVPMSNEPTGVAWNPTNGHFYFSDDGAKEIFDLNPGADGQYGNADDTWISFDTTSVGSSDPEGVAFDSWNNRLFVADGVNNEIYEFTLSGSLVSQFDVEVYGIQDPESVEFNSASGTLFILSSNSSSPLAIETTTSGALLQTIDISAANPSTSAGMTYAPASDGSGAMRFYIVDRGIDNNSNPNIIDGKMYELTAPGGTNAAPIANDDNASTLVDTPVTINVTANDSDPDGNLDPVSANTTCTSCSNPANGTLVNNGDGSFTYTPNTGFIGTDNFTYEVCDTDNLCDIASVSITVEDQNTSISIIYVSSAFGGNVGGVSFGDEDILAFDMDTGAWSMYFDGSDVGLGASGLELDAFHIDTDESILLSFSDPITLPDIGNVDEFDIIRFTPTSTGDTTTGSYELFFDGSDVDLADAAEDIDAIGIAPDGRLTISTRGSFSIGGISGADEDLLSFTPTSLGDVTSGSWELYFDGSDVELSDGGNDEDVNGIWIDNNGDIYLTTRISFSVEGVAGDRADILTCIPGSTGDTTSCTYSLFWDGSANGFDGQNLNGLFLAR